MVLAALVAGGLYLVSGSLTSGLWRPPVDDPRGAAAPVVARRRCSSCCWRIGAWLRRAEHLLEPTTLLFGASYADVMGRMPASLLLAAACIVGAVLAVVQAFTTRNWPIPVAVGLYLVVSVGGELYSSAMQRFVVAPNEQTASRRTSSTTSTPRGGPSGSTPSRSASCRATRCSPRPTSAATPPRSTTCGCGITSRCSKPSARSRRSAPTTSSASVDNDRYRVDGQLRQVMLSARELNSASLPNRTWVNERLTFTHGYGLTLGPVNQVTSEGLPVLFVRDLPPVTSPPFTIDEPSLYYGEFSSDYVIVKTKTREFHYPRGDDNVFKEYAGKGGRAAVVVVAQARLRVPLRRLPDRAERRHHAGKPHPLQPQDRRARADDRAVPGVRSRPVSGAGRRAPVLDLRRLHDLDALSVLGAGRRAASTTSATPSSSSSTPTTAPPRPTWPIPRDPIAAAYSRAFPGLFAPLDRMPAAIREHVRYPEDIFGLQARVFATYHMTQPAVFYNREDQWEVPTIDEGQRRAPDAALLHDHAAARRDARPSSSRCCRTRRGAATTWRHGWWRAATANTTASCACSSSRSRSSSSARGRWWRASTRTRRFRRRSRCGTSRARQVIWGTLMVIPVEESLIYVRPLYLKASGGRIPELTRVIVAYQNQIVMEDTLEEGLARIFGARGAPSAPAAAPPGGTQTSAPPTAGADRGCRSGRRRERRPGGRGPHPLRPRDCRPARRRLGEVRRGDPRARRRARADAPPVTSCA